MTTEIVEYLMGLGSWTVDFKDPESSIGDLDLYDHVVVSEGEKRILTAPILKRTKAPKAQLGGPGFEWWLGQDDDGPLIEDREYVAGNNKVSNGSFEDQELFWRVDEDTHWVFRSVPGEPYDGEWAAVVVGAPTQDDVLQSDESFECKPSQWFQAQCKVKRATPSVGQLRIRIVFSGRFRHPNLIDNTFPWTDTSDTLGDASDAGDTLIVGPTTERQSIKNASFEDVPGLTHWYDQDGRGWVTTGPPDIGQFEGFACVTIPAYGAGLGSVLLYDDNELTAPPAVEPIVVVPGESIFLQAAFTPWAAAGGVTHADGRVYIGVLLLDAMDASPVWLAGEEFGVNHVPNPGWSLTSFQFTVPEGHVFAIPFIQTYDVTVGTWAFDAFTLTHQQRNEAAIDAPLIWTQTPERTYRLLAPITADLGTQGTIRARVRFQAPGRADVIIESPTMDPTNGEEKLLSFDYEPPSGYTSALVSFVGTDVKGGSFRIRKSGVTLVDNDPTTKIPKEMRSGESTVGWETIFVNIIGAPAGCERCHVEIVAEAEDPAVVDPWVVDGMIFSRVPYPDPPDLAHDIVADLLTDPDTGLQLVPAGTIHAAGIIDHDWHIRNLSNRDALFQLSRTGMVEPAREWRITPAPALDWGTQAEIFTDRTDVIFKPGDLTVREPPDHEEDVSGRPTRVKVIGADRTPVGGTKQIITGAAEVDPGSAKDWYGNPLRRTRLLEDSTIDTPDYAAGTAAIELDRAGAPAETTEYDLADWRAAGTFDVGDTVYVYEPDAGLEDPDNPVDVDGVTIWPVGRRVIARTWELGAGDFKVELRKSADGSTVDVTEFVQWADKTGAHVELGDARPEFAVDPQGGGAAKQFRKYRASTGR